MQISYNIQNLKISLGFLADCPMFVFFIYTQNTAFCHFGHDALQKCVWVIKLHFGCSLKTPKHMNKLLHGNICQKSRVNFQILLRYRLFTCYFYYKCFFYLFHFPKYWFFFRPVFLSLSWDRLQRGLVSHQYFLPLLQSLIYLLAKCDQYFD